MHGWKVDGPRLRDLRVEAEIKVVDFADLLGCHERHYRKLEREQPSAQPSEILAQKIRRVLTEHLGRNVELSDFGRAVPSQRAAA